MPAMRGVLSPAVGRAYRDTILAKGRSEDASALLEHSDELDVLGGAPRRRVGRLALFGLGRSAFHVGSEASREPDTAGDRRVR